MSAFDPLRTSLNALASNAMGFFVHHCYGACDSDPSPSIFPLLLEELEERVDDQEHATVSVIHESEWGLTFSRGGYVSYENVDAEDQPRHMQRVSREKAIKLMQSLSVGDFASLEREPWQPGY
jgi:hypothetical protein